MTAADVEAATLRELARSAVQHLRAAALSITATANALDLMLNAQTAEPNPWQQDQADALAEAQRTIRALVREPEPVRGVETVGQPERVEVTAPDGSTVLPAEVAAEVLATTSPPCSACGGVESVHAERGGHQYVRPVERTVPLPPPATGPAEALPYPCRRGAPVCTESFDSPQALGAHHRHAHPRPDQPGPYGQVDRPEPEPEQRFAKLAFREAPSDAVLAARADGRALSRAEPPTGQPAAAVMTVCAECSHSARMHDEDGCRYGRASLDGACSCLTPPGQIG